MISSSNLSFAIFSISFWYAIKLSLNFLEYFLAFITTHLDVLTQQEDFILDDGNWVIRYIVVDTRNWLPGRKVIVNPSWIQSVDWFQERVTVDLTKEQVESSPEYDPTVPANQKYEIQLYDSYARPQ